MTEEQSFRDDIQSDHMNVEEKFNWTSKLDEQLKELHVLYQGSWKAISTRLNGPKPLECLQRWTQIHPDQSRSRQLWSPEEDEQLQELVQKYGKKWSKICTIMNWRTGKQVRERYLNQLQGTINNTKWSEEEDKLILKLYKKFGTKWSYISSFLNGRPENMVKNRFYANLRRRFQCDSDDSDDEDIDSQSSQKEQRTKNKRKRRQVHQFREISKIKKMSSDIDQGTFTRMTRSKSSKNSDYPQQEGIVKDEILDEEDKKSQQDVQQIKIENIQGAESQDQGLNHCKSQPQRFYPYHQQQTSPLNLTSQIGLVQLQQSIMLPLQLICQAQQQQRQQIQQFPQQQQQSNQFSMIQDCQPAPTNMSQINPLFINQWTQLYQQLSCQILQSTLQQTEYN